MEFFIGYNSYGVVLFKGAVQLNAFIDKYRTLRIVLQCDAI